MSRLPRLPAGPRAPKLGALRRYKERPVPLARLSPPEDSGGRTWPSPPVGWSASLAEWLVYWAHGPLGRGEVGLRWLFQTPLYGDLAIIGFVPDFIELDVQVAIDVLHEPAGHAAVRTLREAILARLGMQYVVIDERLARLNPLAALREALLGRDVGG